MPSTRGNSDGGLLTYVPVSGHIAARIAARFACASGILAINPFRVSQVSYSLQCAQLTTPRPSAQARTAQKLQYPPSRPSLVQPSQVTAANGMSGESYATRHFSNKASLAASSFACVAT